MNPSDTQKGAYRRNILNYFQASVQRCPTQGCMQNKAFFWGWKIFLSCVVVIHGFPSSTDVMARETVKNSFDEIRISPKKKACN